MLQHYITTGYNRSIIRIHVTKLDYNRLQQEYNTAMNTHVTSLDYNKLQQKYNTDTCYKIRLQQVTTGV